MDKFIKVQKGEEIIEIHPDALSDHQRLGWQVVEEEPVSAETPSGAMPAPPPTEEKSPKGRRK